MSRVMIDHLKPQEKWPREQVEQPQAVDDKADAKVVKICVAVVVLLAGWLLYPAGIKADAAIILTQVKPFSPSDYDNLTSPQMAAFNTLHPGFYEPWDQD